MAAAASGRVFQFKLVLLGDSAVGKSSLVLRFVRGQFFEYQESTIGAAFLTQTVALNDTTVKFEIWDTAGQERFASLAPMYYRGAAAAIVRFLPDFPASALARMLYQVVWNHSCTAWSLAQVVYDITSEESLQVAKKWVSELRQKGSKGMVIALAGNKLDMVSVSIRISPSPMHTARGSCPHYVMPTK